MARALIVLPIITLATIAMPLGDAAPLRPADWYFTSAGAGWTSADFMPDDDGNVTLGIEVRHTGTPAAVHLEVRNAAGDLIVSVDGIADADKFYIRATAGGGSIDLSARPIRGGAWSAWLNGSAACVTGFGLGGTFSFNTSVFEVDLQAACLAEGGSAFAFGAGPVIDRTLYGGGSTPFGPSSEGPGALLRLLDDFEGSAWEAGSEELSVAGGAAETELRIERAFTGFFMPASPTFGPDLFLSASGPEGEHACRCHFSRALAGTWTFRVAGADAGFGTRVVLAGVDV